MLKKKDIIIFSALAAAMVIGVLLVLVFSKSGKSVTVRKDGKEIFSASLFTDKEIDTGGNIVIVKGGTVYVKSADCKNQICVKHKAISKAGESIICLPNKVIIEIE